MASLKEINDKIPRRAILGILMFLACMFSYVIRTNLSINIVEMVKPPGNGSHTTGPICTGSLSKGNSTLKINGVRYEWNEKIQGLVLGSYFVGPVLSSIPAGMLAERFGGARVVAWATLVPALLNLLMPFAASIHWGIVLPLRFLMGFTGSAVYPALHAMIARWAPPNEKGTFVWTMQGGPFGVLVTFSLCALIIDKLNWQAAFYITSGLMLIFHALWMWLAYDTPDDHPTITEKEKNYIKQQIGTTTSKKRLPLPIRAMITSPPFLSLLWAHFANMWGIYFISTNGPKYTLGVLGMDLKSGAFLTGLPYIARLGGGALFAAAGDQLRTRKILSVGSIRKIFMIFSHLGPGVALIAMTYANCDAVIAVIMMILALAFNGAACQTSLQNHQDLAPNFAGSLYGTMNVFGSIPGFIIPPIIGALTHERNGIEEWRWIFWITAIVFFSATALFWIFGSGNIQPWNDYSQSSKNDNTVEEEKQMTDIHVKEFMPSDEEAEENQKL